MEEESPRAVRAALFVGIVGLITVAIILILMFNTPNRSHVIGICAEVAGETVAQDRISVTVDGGYMYNAARPSLYAVDGQPGIFCGEQLVVSAVRREFSLDTFLIEAYNSGCRTRELELERVWVNFTPQNTDVDQSGWERWQALPNREGRFLFAMGINISELPVINLREEGSQAAKGFEPAILHFSRTDDPDSGALMVKPND